MVVSIFCFVILKLQGGPARRWGYLVSIQYCVLQRLFTPCRAWSVNSCRFHQSELITRGWERRHVLYVRLWSSSDDASHIRLSKQPVSGHHSIPGLIRRDSRPANFDQIQVADWVYCASNNAAGRNGEGITGEQRGRVRLKKI